MILRRIDGSRFSEVAPIWGGMTAVILGGGPSLTPEQVALVRRAREVDTVRVIAVNDTYLLAPWADVQYAADAHWHRWHSQGIERHVPGIRTPFLNAAQVAERWADFAGQKCSVDSGDAIADPAVHLLKIAGQMGLSLDQRALMTGRNSGFQALNLAVLAGAKLVILLGFDGKPSDAGRGHWFGEHPYPTPVAAYPLYRQAMSAAENALIAAGVTVLNCSPGSAIDNFPKMKLEEVL
jgi:hypothetical protein